MSENLKSESSCRIFNDFVERNGVMQELTVTITLREYRNLVSTNADLLTEVYALKREVDKLTEQNKNLSQALIACNGGKMLRVIGKAIGDAFKADESEEEETEETE